MFGICFGTRLIRIHIRKSQFWKVKCSPPKTISYSVWTRDLLLKMNEEAITNPLATATSFWSLPSLAIQFTTSFKQLLYILIENVICCSFSLLWEHSQNRRYILNSFFSLLPVLVKTSWYAYTVNICYKSRNITYHIGADCAENKYKISEATYCWFT